MLERMLTIVESAKHAPPSPFHKICPGGHMWNSKENQEFQQTPCTYLRFIVLQGAVIDVHRRLSSINGAAVGLWKFPRESCHVPAAGDGENSRGNQNNHIMLSMRQQPTYPVLIILGKCSKNFPTEVAMSGRAEMEENSNENQKLQQISCTYLCFIVLQRAVIDAHRR